MRISHINRDNFPEIVEIYLQGISTQIATFQNEAPSWEEWDKSHLSSCRLVALLEGKICGWAALSPVSSRCVYSGVAEVSIYIGQEHRGKGIGKALLHELIHQSEKEGIWTLQSSIFSENLPSIKLHESCGFRMVGYREKIGLKNGVWKDNVLMERRSNKIGIE
ncbi:GCN5-related N-acetyltransferase [Leadbetterella byssophila DSM 17132]|uniref:GCN5-related N-acetyltransferase n=1 Tax=Leadbetterella byssophila (strain DSM 17132 / JCM 16389 / KACC 11308 / NBRC 106382 / 4M15) TaxID=649349 RepID=E4RR56_LEAB4|nr:GNAT family N-acetyltransferase [Leadbetterella byssophila]ADQ16651.1 GCN5-related N-acetyltransferase [Leadbetterella byssophila DSM 17132]